jgi:two-component system, OmpR family, KDP operon response regulator KdpE
VQKVLIVEDDDAMVAALRDGFEYEGFTVSLARDGADGLRQASTDAPELVILDVMLPKMSGFDVCREIRKAGNNVPIIMLTARGQEIDKVLGLKLGADDYVTKPFGPEELLARIRVALRRAGAEETGETGLLTAGALTIDYDRRRVVRDGAEIRLTPKEFDLLSLLAKNHDRVLTHRTILKAVWGPNAVEQPEHLWTLVAQLRKKIEPDPGAPKYLVSEPWVGYRFVTDT